MATGRMISKKISVSEKVANLPIDGQLLYERMIIHTDDFGFLQAAPRTIRAIVVPMIDELTTARVGILLQQMIGLDLVTPISYQNADYLYIIKHREEQTSKLRKDLQPSTILPISNTSKPQESWKKIEEIANSLIDGTVATTPPPHEQTNHVTEPSRERNDHVPSPTTEVKRSEEKIYNTGKPKSEQKPIAAKRPVIQRPMPMVATKSKSMASLREVMVSRGITTTKPKDTKNGIATEWQAKAFLYAEKLKIKLDASTTPRWLKVFKQAHFGRKTANLEKAYSYLSDHPKPMDGKAKLNFFFAIYERGLTALPA
jgi:hypothetical protein